MEDKISNEIIDELNLIKEKYKSQILNNVDVYNNYIKISVLGIGVKPFKLETFRYLLTNNKFKKPEQSDFRDKIIFCSKIGIFVGSNYLGFFNKEYYQSLKYHELDKQIIIDYNSYSLKLFGKTFPLLKKPNKLELEMIEEISQVSNNVNLRHLKEKEEKEKIRIEKLKVSQLTILNELDNDGNGEVDVIEGNDFNLLLKKHQNSIKEIDRTYVQKFIKVSNYLKIKKENIQSIFNSLENTPDEKTLFYYVQILKDDIHSYNLVLFNSLNMIVSLVEDDTITFYEIHEKFDNLNIFDTKHERDVSKKLSNIGDGLKELMLSIEEMGRDIQDQLSDLTYVSEQSNQLLENQLQSINSSIDTNNLLTGINSYQTYKLRKGE